MNVAAAARAAGISPSGVRWYEAIGALPAAPRGENGYRTYSERDVSQLRLILALRRLGLGAAEAGRLARLNFEGESARAELAIALEREREAITGRRVDLDWLEGELGDLEATLHATRRPARKPRSAPIAVLFLCNANSGRSQIGEALLAKAGGARFRVQSAGAEPSPVSELAVTVLSEAGIDWRGAHSKRVNEVRGPFDYVIALSDSMRESCASLEGGHSTLHWHFPDPGGNDRPPDARLAAYRRIRDELSLRLIPFVELALQTAAAWDPESRPKEVKNG